MFRVLTVYYKHKPGGFCRRLKFKIEAFLNKGWEVHYIAVKPFPYTHPKLKPHILPTPMAQHDSLMFWVYFFTTIPFFTIWVGIKNNINLITSGSPLYAFFCGPAKGLLKVPMLTLILSKPHFHSESKSIAKTFFGLEYFLEKLGLKWSNLSLANSWGSGEAWKTLHNDAGETIQILPNHIDAPTFDKSQKRKKILDEFSLDSRCFIVTNTGLLQKLKNLDLLIKAIAKVNDKKVILLLVGEGKEKEALKKLAESTGVANQVIFTGWRTDAREIVQGSDLFVFPSFREGMAESLLEATTCQVPCLVSSIPENTDVIQNPEQHFPPDCPEILTEKINRLLIDKEYYRNLCDSTNEDKNRFVFDWDQKFMEFVETLMKNN